MTSATGHTTMLTAPTFPHKFPTLRDPSKHRTILIAGAGFSAPEAPTPCQLVRDRAPEAEKELGIDTHLLCDLVNNPPSLYKWADAVLAAIDGKPGITIPKLALALALGLDNDPDFVPPHANIPAQPRHLVLASVVFH
jgi:hypothetical protein